MTNQLFLITLKNFQINEQRRTFVRTKSRLMPKTKKNEEKTVDARTHFNF